MDQPNEKPSADEFRANDLAERADTIADTTGSKLKEILASVAAFLTAVVTVGGGIYLLLRDAGSLHGVNASSSVSAAVGPTAAIAPAPSIQGSEGSADGPRANGATIYRCEVNGKTVYANVPCSSTKSRPVDVFVNKGFEPIDTSPLRVRQSASAEPAGTASSNDSAREERCNGIENAIRQSDATAGLPQSGWTQDQLTEEKRRLLDEKNELKC